MKGSATDREFAAKVYKLTGELIASGKFKPNPVRKYPQGLAGVEQGFKDAEAGKVPIPPINELIILRCEQRRWSTQSLKRHDGTTVDENALFL